MGNKVGKLYLMATRPIRNINVEQRAHKVISKEKPIPAPQYPSTLRQIKVAEEFDPDFMEKQKVKDSKLDEKLKQIFVTSSDSKPDAIKSDSTKSLPTSRKTFDYEDLNYYYPSKVKEGKCSVQHLQLILTNHMNDPQKHNASQIAEEYRLDKKVVENILEHYKIFRILSEQDLERMKKSKEPEEKIGGIKAVRKLLGISEDGKRDLT